METRGFRVALVTVAALAVTLAGVAALAATPATTTGIGLAAKDGSYIYARTTGYNGDYQYNMLVVPRNRTFNGSATQNTAGYQWTTKYGFIGPNYYQQTWVYDGLNEKGLAVGGYQFPQTGNNQTTNHQNTNQGVAPYQVTSYLLGTCATVQEAVTAMQNVYVTYGETQPYNYTGTWHYAIYDAAGQSAWIEYVNGHINVQQNPQGFITNATTFNGQNTQTQTYVRTAQSSGTAQQCVQQAFRLLKYVGTQNGTTNGGQYTNGTTTSTNGYTNWTTAADMTNLHYYYGNYQGGQMKVVNLNKVDFSTKNIGTIAMQ